MRSFIVIVQKGGHDQVVTILLICGEVIGSRHLKPSNSS